MSDLIMVTGEDCLNYIDRPFGMASNKNPAMSSNSYADAKQYEIHITNNERSQHGLRLNPGLLHFIKLHQITHDTSKRIVGYVTNRYEDGGLRVVILGNELLNFYNNYKVLTVNSSLYSCIEYEEDNPLGLTYHKKDGFMFYPDTTNTQYPNNGSSCWLNNNGVDATFDEMIDYNPEFIDRRYILIGGNYDSISYQGTTQTQDIGAMEITTDENNTLVFGEHAVIGQLRLIDYFRENPLNLVAGNIYNYFTTISQEVWGLCPASMDYEDFMPFDLDGSAIIDSYNGCALVYNMVLTENKNWALNYLNTGTLPPDAFLYPLDFDNLPRYEDPVPTPDKPDDYPDDNNPDDDIRDFDPTPNETPTFTVNQLTNYNWYWLTVPQWADFISWFWNDIGDYSDFDNIIAKVKGLYNDVASAVIMCRYYPVDISWIGGLGTQSNIKLGMIEKAGAVDTISQANALRSVDIGHVHIGQKYKSFMDMSPYSQLSLYLPWHGFIDLDMNLFNGHDVYVKALYDYLSGTIQYYVFYDNEVLVNTILCKMAMDIPITLQTKNDRDSAIFNNVSSTIGGLVGAGAGILSGNPIGMALGVTQGVGAFNSANASAPMRLMGNVGESGAYIGCQNCFVVVRRPTIQPSDGNAQTSTKGLTTWKRNVGMLCGYGYTLSDLSGQGFTTCHSPRIDFTNTAPLQSEVDEIYNYLEKGVIL